MSLIVTVTTSEGVVMASDSRSTLTKSVRTNPASVDNLIFPVTDSVYKTVLVGGRIGVSTCGGGQVNGMSIAWHLETFSTQHFRANDTVQSMCDRLMDYFLAHKDCPVIILHAAGYDLKGNVYFLSKRRMKLGGPKSMRIIQDITNMVINWDGETAVMSRLLKPCFMVDMSYAKRVGTIKVSEVKDGKMVEEEFKDRYIIPGITPYQPEVDLGMQFYTLQDGIDLAKFAIMTTIETMRFQSVPKTVGGPVDVLVLKPGQAKWIAHKELHA